MTVPALVLQASRSQPLQPAQPSPSSFSREQRLPAGRVLGFALSGYAWVRCVSGELWVTGPDTGDLIVGAGESVGIQGRGRVVVEALRDARLDVSP